MDKNAIKKYAVWARNELIARVTQKAEQYEITEKKTTPADADSIGGRLLTDAEKKQRTALIEKIKTDGFEQVMEEVAYTWFNRFTALRFMEVNNYLPSHTRVFTNEAGEFKPQILADAIQLDLEGLNMNKVFELKDANKTEELYKYLLITQCNALSRILPRMFQKIEHYTELLLPDYLLREGSVIEQMITLISEEDWTDQVQIIGWLYQFYNSEPKDAVFAALKKNVKITKENIPAATQLFTPDWIVRYMVENSLGRLWLEGHPNNTLKSEWKYYLDEAEQEVNVKKQLEEIRKEYAALKPEEICCIDPCMGSGHILCYMFDVLVKIYEDYGYTAREAVENIVEKNLWGLDIDERASQLSYFAVMMKARQYDRRFFSKKDENGELRIPQPHVYAMEESNGITSAPMHDMGIGLSQEEYGKAVKEALRLVEEMHDAKEYGSIIHVTSCDWDLLRRFAVPRGVSEGQLRLDIHGEIAASSRLQELINIGEALAQKYHVVVTNPPYMGSSGMSSKLLTFVSSEYPKTKSDLSTVFMERTLSMCNRMGYMAMINIPVWMFLVSFEKQREEIVNQNSFVSLLHFGRGIFGADFGTVSFVIKKTKCRNYIAPYMRLFDKSSAVDPIETKEKWFFEKKGLCYIQQEDFERINGTPIAYWVSHNMLKAFDEYKSLGAVAEPRQGLITGDNDRFLREWYEVEMFKLNQKWFVYNKGGEYRKWYGNNDLVVNWENDGHEITTLVNPSTGRQKSRPQNIRYYFREGFTWTTLSIGAFSARYMPEGQIFDAKGSSCFASSSEKIKTLLGLTNSCVSSEFFKILSPTVDYSAGSIAKLPVAPSCFSDSRITDIIDECIELSKQDWDSFEISWNYKEHPFITSANLAARVGKAITIKQVYDDWNNVAEARFQKLKENEEELNRIFINIYDLGAELTPEVEEKDVTVRRADLQREVRSFISYAVGCMFGRYTLGKPGIIYAGGEWDATKYPQFQPDQDAIIPICDDEYFDDDVVNRFISFVEKIFGKEALEENLQDIADALGGKGSSREVIRNYFINDFYTDHLKVYQKCPIYWLFDSGKKNGFKCLIYMHRYQADTIARIRTDYVHEQQSRYRTAIANLEQRINGSSASERVKLSKQLATLQGQAEEIRAYEEKIHHLADQMIRIDLDDGVKHNYEIFKDVLAKIK